MRDPATIPRADWPTGARLHVGLVFPSPIPPRMVREFYEVVPEGVDLTTVTLSVTHLGDDAIREAGRGIEGACKQLAQYDVDLVYFLGVPPIVLQKPGFHRTLAERMAQASGLPSFTDLDGVLAARDDPNGRRAGHRGLQGGERRTACGPTTTMRAGHGSGLRLGRRGDQ